MVHPNQGSTVIGWSANPIEKFGSSKRNDRPRGDIHLVLMERASPRVDKAEGSVLVGQNWKAKNPGATSHVKGVTERHRPASETREVRYSGTAGNIQRKIFRRCAAILHLSPL